MRIKKLEGKIYLVLMLDEGRLVLAITCPEYAKKVKINGSLTYLRNVVKGHCVPRLLLASTPYFSKVTEARRRSDDIAFSDIHFRLLLPLHEFYE